MRRLLTAIPLVPAHPAGAAPAQLLSTGIGNGISSFSPGFGIGQGVAVATETRLTQLGFWIGVSDPVIGIASGAAASPLRADARVKFMIWNADRSALLFSQTKLVGEVPTITLVESDPFSFTLHAGSTYHFGVIADNGLAFSYFAPRRR
jgi:hypothetical protein